MLQYLVNVIENTFIAGILFAMLCSFIVRLQLSVKSILVGAALVGLLFAVTYAVLKRTTGFAVREYYDLVILLIGLLFSLPILIAMCVPVSKLVNTHYLIKKSLSVVLGINIAMSIGLTLPNLLLYPFEFNVAMESIFNTDYLFKWVGYCLALIIVIVIATTTYRLCLRLTYPFYLCFIIGSFGLYIAQNTINIVQILMVRRLIHHQPWLMDIVMFILSHVNFFIYSIMLLLLVLALVTYIRCIITPKIGKNPAQIRKITAETRRDRRRSLLILTGLAVTTYTVTRARYILENGTVITPAIAIRPNQTGFIEIDITQVNDGNLHRFGYTTSDGIEVRFIVIKKRENAYGIGLDACDICGASGYYQRGDQVVCSLCDVVMNIGTIGLAGGCNPVPLKFTISDGRIQIKPAELDAEKYRFK